MSLHDRMRRLAVLAVSVGVTACGEARFPEGAIETPAEAQVAVDGCGLGPKAVHDAWSEYRRARPFHSQEVAASMPSARGCRVLILSEPPAHVSVESLTAAHPALVGLHVETHPIGVDGWVRDIVGVLPPIPEGDLADLTSDVHVALFGTAYRARLAPIAAPPQWSGSLDVEVRPAEIHDWIFGKEASFWSVDGGPSVRGADLLAPQQTGVYVSRAPGIVLWSLPKSGSFDAQRVNARIFGLESDLVLGAVADADTVLVVGRERIAPESVAPPLRFETLQILATSKLDQLAQSYERNQLFAGQLESGKDWAPILLSQEIVDTELGSVLNIADQLLKSWSMNGMIDYERFDYPNVPGSWAFAQPISRELGGSSLTFNWNTSASGGLVKIAGGRDLYWMNRTGALHVSYLPGDRPDERTTSYEDRARTFFATQNDPYLVRAVQYTALFQAFRQLGVTRADDAADADTWIQTDEATAVLEAAGVQAFKRLANAGDAELKAVAGSLVSRSASSLSDDLKQAPEELLSGLPPERREEIRAYLRRGPLAREAVAALIKRALAQGYAKTLGALRDRLAATNEGAAPKHLAVALVHQRMAKTALYAPARWRSLVNILGGPAARAKADEITTAVAFLRRHHLQLDDVEPWRLAATAFGDVDAVEQRYRLASAGRLTSGRVRTSSVVWSDGSKLRVSGGHNVGSTVAVHATPLSLARLAQVGLDTQGVSFHAAPLPPRPPATALRGTPVRPEPIKFADAGGRSPPPRTPGHGWARLMGEPSSGCGSNCVAVRLFDAPTEGTTGQRSRFKVGIGDSVFRATSSADIADTTIRLATRQARTGGKAPAPVRIQLLDRDVSIGEAHAMRRNIVSRLNKQGIDAEGTVVLHRDGSPISMDGFDLARAEVSEPVQSPEGFTFSISVTKKQGLKNRLLMRLTKLRDGGPEDVAKVKETMVAGLRTPEDLARALGQRFGKDDVPFLLELASDAQPLTTDNEPPARETNHAGTPGHTF